MRTWRGDERLQSLAIDNGAVCRLEVGHEPLTLSAVIEERRVLATNGIVQGEDLRKGRVPPNDPQLALVETRPRQELAPTPRLEVV